jgi:SAM-dependent methyltransferase
VTDENPRVTLSRTFETVADQYQAARPEYPAALYEALIELAGLAASDHLLEVGCATGKATLPLARRGFAITCLEPGPQLAAAARRNLAGFDVTVVESTFEQWEQPPTLFALVFAATSWHWIDPAVRYPKASALLVPGGHFAFWSAVHVLPDGGDTFFDEIQDVYSEIGEIRSGEARPQPGQLPDGTAEITASGLFDVVGVLQFDWALTYDADSYIALLETFSSHILMAPWQRDRLYGEIRRRLAGRPDGQLRCHWGAALTVARRRSIH